MTAVSAGCRITIERCAAPSSSRSNGSAPGEPAGPDAKISADPGGLGTP
jgi:hypothetical protein